MPHTIHPPTTLDPTTTVVEKHIADLGKIYLEYTISGKKNEQAILFVHGLGANQSQFEYQHPFFNETYCVIAVSLRGHGNSSPPKKMRISDFRLKRLCKDLITLLQELHIEKIHYVGNSMGGNIGYEMLKSYPEKLLSLTTFGTTAYLKKSPFVVGLIKLVYQVVGTKTLSHLSNAAGITPYSKQKIKDMIAATQTLTVMNLIPHLRKINYLKTIKKSRTRAMIIRGNMDDEINNVLESTITCFLLRGNFELKELKNAGHFANLDDPENFNHTLLSFLKTV